MSLVKNLPEYQMNKAIFEFNSKRPIVGEKCFIAPSSAVIGDVVLKNGASIWFNTVVRGDIEQISIGQESNVQDLSMLHTTYGLPLVIEDFVSVGHQVTLHSCVIKAHCLVGMGAVVLDGAEIGENSVVGAGSVIPPGKKYPSGVLILGNPGKVVRELTPEELKRYAEHYLSYTHLKDQYLIQSED